MNDWTQERITAELERLEADLPRLRLVLSAIRAAKRAKAIRKEDAA